MLETICSNAIIALLIGSFAWSFSRIYQSPSLWHAVWVLTLLKLFLPPVWSLPIPSMGEKITRQAAVIDGHPDSPDAGFHRTAATLGSSRRASTVATSLPDIVKPRGKFVDVSWRMVATTIWLLGSITVLFASTISILRFNRLVDNSPAVDEATQSLFESLIADVAGHRHRPTVRFVDQVVPPLLWPVGMTPTIVLPRSWWQTISLPQQRTVLVHEIVHWRRRDHWIRLLQWISSIVFWWHPLVWIARNELHRLEEQCCDAEVLFRLPNHGRAYASALLSASQSLEDQVDARRFRYRSAPLALPMSDTTLFASFHRRIEMLPKLVYRPWTPRQTLAVLLLALVPLGIGLSAAAQQTQPATSTGTAILFGHVTGMDGKPLADAVVRVVIPTADLRFPIDSSEHREIWGQTDAAGSYSIEIDNIKKEAPASIDILHPGHRRLVGTLMSGGDPNEVALVPGKRVEFGAKLPPSLYFAGRVVDEAGEPIEGVLVGSFLNGESSSVGVERSVTDASGRFAVYSYEPSFFAKGENDPAATALLGFEHDRYIDASVEKLEDVDPTKREQLLIELRSGHSIAGSVETADGKPAKDVVVSLVQQGAQRKAVLTDGQGHFRIAGLADGTSQLRIVDAVGKQRFLDDLNIDGNKTDMRILLEPFDVPISNTHSMLGMTLVDVTQALDEAYDLKMTNLLGVMILAPGKQFEDLEIGELRPGYVFWMVGNDRVSNIRELVSHLVQEAKVPTIGLNSDGNPSAWIEDDGDAKVRVVYSYDSETGRGTNTQYMRVTPKDVEDLEQLLKGLGMEKPATDESGR